MKIIFKLGKNNFSSQAASAFFQFLQMQSKLDSL